MGKIVALLLLSCQIFASEINEDPEVELDIPFKKIEHPWLVEAVLELPLYSFYLGAPAVDGVAYVPNFAPRLGPRLVYREFGAMITFSLPIPELEKYRRGDSVQENFIFNSYWRQFAYDIFYQRIQGFYVSSPFTELSVRKPDRYPQLPDTRVLNTGLNLYYVFNPKSYSLRAAFDQQEFQLKSGGSWLVNPFFTHFEIALGQIFILGSSSNMLSSLPNVASGRFDTSGIAVGYGYTYIYGHRFLTFQGAWGPGFQLQRLRRGDGGESEVGSFAAKLNVNLAGGWNYTDYVAGVKILVDSLWARVQDTQLSSSLVSGQVFFGRRF